MGTIKRIVWWLSMTCCPVLCAAFESPAVDVPPVAQHEIARRGNHVEQTGTIRSGLMAAALSPPADDSAKWFLTLVYRPGEEASERMRTSVELSVAMRPWVDAHDPAKSSMHYQLRSVDDATQSDWLANLRPKLAADGLPCVVLQPPKNGRFGSSAVIVKLIHGAMSGEELSRRLRDGIVRYVQTVEVASTAPSTLDPQLSTLAGIGVPPPFDVAPKPRPKPRDEPPEADETVEWPPVPPKTPPPAEPPPNPTVPAPGPPTSTLGLVIGVLTFAAGMATMLGYTWVSGRLAALIALARAIEQASRPPVPPPSP